MSMCPCISTSKEIEIEIEGVRRHRNIPLFVIDALTRPFKKDSLLRRESKMAFSSDVQIFLGP